MTSTLMSTSLSTKSVNSDFDFRKYIVTDPERIHRQLEDITSLPFTCRILNLKEQIIQQQSISNHIIFPSIVNIYGL